MSTNIKSPCIQVCKYDEDGICTGCYRTMNEITGWLFMNDQQKAQSLMDAEVRKKTPKTSQNNYEHYV